MLDDEQVVRAAPGQVGGVVALGMQRIGGDDRAGDVHAVQQGGEHGDLGGNTPAPGATVGRGEALSDEPAVCWLGGGGEVDCVAKLLQLAYHCWRLGCRSTHVCSRGTIQGMSFPHGLG